MISNLEYERMLDEAEKAGEAEMLSQPLNLSIIESILPIRELELWKDREHTA
jgi:hypothetical protein